MVTVGQLIQHLSCLDPDIPVGVVDIDRHPHSQRATISLRAVIDSDTVHDPRTGQPLAVWLSAQPLGTSGALEQTQPTTIVLPRHPCGCLIPVTLQSQRSVNLDAFACPHHQPSDLIVRSATQPRP